MLLLVFLYALLAGTFSLGKIMLRYTQPIFFVGTRMSIAGGILLLYHAYKDRTRFKIKKEDIGQFCQAMLFTIYIPYILRYWGLQYLPASKACLLYNFGPFMSYTFSYLLFSEKITVKKIIGLMIGFCGLLPIITHTTGGALAGSFPLLPECALLISVASLSYGWLIIHRLINQHNYPPSMVNGICMLVGGLLALVTSVFLEDSARMITETIPFITLLAIIVVVSNLICHNLYGVLLKRFTPTMMSFAGFMSPLFAAFYGWLFMAEELSLNFFIASATVFVGLALFYYDELQQNMSLKKNVLSAHK